MKLICNFLEYKIAPSWFEARVIMLFKRITVKKAAEKRITVEKTSDKNMKIPQIADRNVIKNLRM